METNLYTCTRTGRMISEKAMEDGNVSNTRDDKTSISALANLYVERPAKLTTNGHDLIGEPSNRPGDVCELRRTNTDVTHDDKHRKRINPLRIHLGKRPFVDNSLQYYNPGKKKKSNVSKISDNIVNSSTPRVPKLIPKCNQFHNVTSHPTKLDIDNEQDKPVPRLVPKSQSQLFKKEKAEKASHLKDYTQSSGHQSMVKFKCRKCCSMSFKTLSMLKEHQLVCRAQAKEPAISPEIAGNVAGGDISGGPSRVTRKVYLCSACGTYYENWNLFLHMREIHNRHICLFCLGMFSKADKLLSHLTNKHNVTEHHYNSKEEYFNHYNGTLYLMCCGCDDICSEQDNFFDHDCNNVKPKPVPLLVSKNAVKTSVVKSNTEVPQNGPSEVQDIFKSLDHKRELRLDMNSSKIQNSTDSADVTCDTGNCEISTSPKQFVSTSKDVNNAEDSGMELESLDSRMASTPPWNAQCSDSIKNTLQNGEENVHNSEESDSHVSDDPQLPEPSLSKSQDTYPIIEKECGIKLKLSLNNANSPVIINSTVDPSVGQQNYHKPCRTRRPPKRYEKPVEKATPEMSQQPRTPSIKMTICDRADSPFVKTTIYENDKETIVKTIMNNNSDIAPKTLENNMDNAVKTTIYDNKPDDNINIMNRVPKLTVRVPKELLDKDSSSDYSSDSDIGDKLTMDENNKTIEEEPEPKAEIQPETCDLPPENNKDTTTNESEEKVSELENSNDLKIEDSEVNIEKTEVDIDMSMDLKPDEPSLPVTELALDRPIDKYPLKELLKVFLTSTVHNCIYCNHVRKIAVNCEQLSLHMVAEHRFSATVDSITAEELMPETITAKLKAGAEELSSTYINLDSYDSVEKIEKIQFDNVFECFPCYFKTPVHKDLCLHNRKMHQKPILLCVMCKCNFFSYSELLCHLCPGTNDFDYEVNFRCCLCRVDSIPSQFRLMVHLRKVHHTCDVCLEFCHNQARLSNHVWKHKLNHFCHRCDIAYRNKLDITNHLFWKHGTESVLCKRCNQKKWPHVYHFCSPPAIFVCDECNLQFTKAVYLKVHKRFHSNEFPHICNDNECTEKFVSRKLLSKHVEKHKKATITEETIESKISSTEETSDLPKETVPVIDLVDEKPTDVSSTSETKNEIKPEQPTKKTKKKKNKDPLLLDVNLPALNLSESDSSDESDSGLPPSTKEDSQEECKKEEVATVTNESNDNAIDKTPPPKEENKVEPAANETAETAEPNEQEVLDIWDNFQKYQAKVDKQKTPPLVPIRKHVCESDHDYCLVPTDLNGEDLYGITKKKNKKSPKKHHSVDSSSSSSSSDSDSSCSCGSNCSCSSSSGSSSSSTSDSDSSDESGTEKKKTKRTKKTLPDRRISTGSNVDVMGMSETPILIPEKVEPTIAETDLETEESETDEEFYDENPRKYANKSHEEKRNQLLTTLADGDTHSDSLGKEHAASAENDPLAAGDTHIDVTNKDEHAKIDNIIKDSINIAAEPIEKVNSGKKKSKKKKKSKSSKKRAPIKINIPKDVIAKSEPELPPNPSHSNRITITLQTNKVQIPEAKVVPPVPATPATAGASATPGGATLENKRASKRRRVPNKFYGYSSDEESSPQTTIPAALKPQLPPKLEWRKEDLPSPVTHKAKKEPLPIAVPTRLSYTEPMNTLRLTAPIPDPEPPKILMNSESLDSDESDSSEEGHLQIYQPAPPPPPIPPPTYLNSGTSSLPYPFQRPAVREARAGESVYCYCRCPYDEVSEMIACDAEGCPIEWFHFECVGIMVPPKGKWYCPECRKNQNFPGYR